MTSFKRGDVVLAHVVFTDGTSTKKRPAIIVSGNEYHKERDEVIVTAVSSNTKRTLFGDILLQDWKHAGLLYPSTATGIFFTIKKNLVERCLGTLSKTDLHAVEKNLKGIFEINGGHPEKKDKATSEAKNKKVSEKESPKKSLKLRKTTRSH